MGVDNREISLKIGDRVKISPEGFKRYGGPGTMNPSCGGTITATLQRDSPNVWLQVLWDNRHENGYQLENYLELEFPTRI